MGTERGVSGHRDAETSVTNPEIAAAKLFAKEQDLALDNTFKRGLSPFQITQAQKVLNVGFDPDIPLSEGIVDGYNQLVVGRLIRGGKKEVAAQYVASGGISFNPDDPTNPVIPKGVWDLLSPPDVFEVIKPPSHIRSL